MTLAQDFLDTWFSQPGALVARALATLLTRCTEEKLVHGDAHIFNVGFRGVEDAIFLDFGRSCSVEDFLRRREELATAGFGDVEPCLSWKKFQVTSPPKIFACQFFRRPLTLFLFQKHQNEA